MADASITEESTSRFVQAGDVRVHVHEAGEGPALVCIHGGAPGAYGWGNFGQNVADLARNFRVIVVDLPGYGKSDKPEVAGGRYAFYAKVFADMLGEMGIEKAHLCGLATGGAASIMMSLQYPEVVDRMVLVGSPGGLPLFSVTPSEGIKVIQRYYGGDGPSMQRMREYVELTVFDKSLITEDIVRERYEASVQPEFMVQAPEGRGVRPVIEDLSTELHKVPVKTLVVWGRDNRLQGYDNALYMLNQIPDVEVHIYGRTGLWVPFERREEFRRLLLSFLEPPSA